jgi:hypothetical protein
MRTFRIRGRCLDRGPGGADSLLDFLFSRCQRIVRDVQRALLDFGFDYAVHRFDCVGYFLLVSGICQFLYFDSSSHRFAETRIGLVRLVLHVPLKDVRVRRDDSVYPATLAPTLRASIHRKRLTIYGSSTEIGEGSLVR